VELSNLVNSLGSCPKNVGSKPSSTFLVLNLYYMIVNGFKVCYLVKLCWQSYSSYGLQRLEVERSLLGIPFSFSFNFKKLRIYVLRSAHAQNKSAECLESCIWVGKSQFFCLSSVYFYLESHLLFNEGSLFYKLICFLGFFSFNRFELFFLTLKK
jgi:hypothetical protein